ncbi:MAG: hydantoinase/oxoprolinase family protein [Thermodesulfobacteriota bacterium]|nr:hydantoinase/oxoprolinase family protein [Thermodesulfobacteriota bacterium]
MIIGLDVGGTHTDVVLLDKDGLLREIKVTTDPSDLFNSVLTGLIKITEGIEPEKIKRIVLSTTLTTNAIVQRKFSPVGMIVSGGPGLDPELYRTNKNYFAVSGSIDHRGKEIEPVNEDEIKEIGNRFQKENIPCLGVVSKFSVRNPEHERKIHEILKGSFEKVFLGHRISGNLNFPRRIATTYLNAAVYPIHKAFYEAVQKSLEAKGLSPTIRILKADGGNMNFNSSIDIPGQTILSGPAASIMGSVAFSSKDEDTLIMDIGGTTTDMSILIDRVPLLAPLGIRLGHYKTLIRSLDTLSIGVGGDSAVKIKNGQLNVGPERPGPAMAFGGPVPTPTDALFVLDEMKNGDREKSVKGIKPMAKQLGLSVEAAALEIFEFTCKKILSEAEKMIERTNKKPVYTVHELQEGYKIVPQKILVLGGPALCFATHLERISPYKVEVVSRWAVANAIGAALARTTCEVNFYADTERGVATAPAENYFSSINRDFDRKDAVKNAFDLLKQKALQRGADPDHIEMEVLETMQFNMVRGFSASGKNIRVKVQVKPGLIHGYDDILANLTRSS